MNACIHAAAAAAAKALDVTVNRKFAIDDRKRLTPLVNSLKRDIFTDRLVSDVWVAAEYLTTSI